MATLLMYNSKQEINIKVKRLDYNGLFKWYRKSRKGFSYFYLGSPYVANNIQEESPNALFTLE